MEGRIKAAGKMGHVDFLNWVPTAAAVRARGKGLLYAQGIEVRRRWWQGDGWLEVQSDPRLKDWMKEQLIGWRNKVLSTDEEQDALRERIAALAPAILPKGIGAYSAAVLFYEMRDFERF